jgi:hypothetical protein
LLRPSAWQHHFTLSRTWFQAPHFEIILIPIQIDAFHYCALFCFQALQGQKQKKTKGFNFFLKKLKNNFSENMAR